MFRRALGLFRSITGERGRTDQVGHPRSVGIVTSVADGADLLIQTLIRAQVVSADAEITVLDADYRPAPDAAIPRRHLFWDSADAGFDLVACSSTVRFFEGLWGTAFVELLKRNCKSGGTIVVPHHQGPASSPSLYFSPSMLERQLGIADMQAVPGYACFHEPGRVASAMPPSMLSWATSRVNDQAVRQHVANADAMDAALVTDLARTGSPIEIAPDFARDLARIAEIGARSDVFNEPDTQFLRTFTYWIGGLAYKAPAVTRVARLCGVAEGAKLIDYGAGAGQLAVDCALDAACPIEEAIAVDLFAGNALVFDRIARDLEPALQGRVRYVAGSLARWLPTEPVDMITCLGALLYLPRGEVEATLSGWWRMLKPGGVLLIHENLRHSETPPSRDRDRMFFNEELTAVLARLGRQKFFGATEMKELSPEEAAGKNVFRYVQKAR